MFVYYLHYIIVSLVSSLSIFKSKNTKYIAVVVFVLLVALAGFRGQVGRDYTLYIKYFNALTSDNFDYFGNKFLFYEPSNYALPYLLKLIFGREYFIQLCFLLFAFLGVYYKMKAMEMSNSFFLSILIYLTNFYLLHEMVQIRAGIASGIFLLSIKHIYNRNFGKFLLYILWACFFHYSSALYLFLYFLNPASLNKIWWIIVLSSFSILSLLGINIFDLTVLSFIPKIQAYIELMKAGGDFVLINVWTSFAFLINFLLTFFLLLKSSLLIDKNKYFIILLKINILSIIAYMSFASMPVFAARVSQLLGVVQIILFPIIVYAFKEKIIPYTIIVLISLSFFYYYFIQLDFFKPYYTWIQQF